MLISGCSISPGPDEINSATPAAPPAAIDEILAAAGTHELVALGEVHGSVREHAFLRELMDDPRVPSAFDDVAVEFGASEHQDIIDRFVRGEDLPISELRLVWTQTSQTSGVWDAPVYREFFESVRAVNEGLPRAAQLRVILTDLSPPTCRPLPSCADESLVDRDAHMADVVRRESLAKGRRVLFVAGLFHLLRSASVDHRSAVDRLESDHTSTYVIVPGEGPAATNLARFTEGLTAPALESLAGTELGRQPASDLHGSVTIVCDHPPCGTPDYPGTLADVADAYLFLGS